MCLFFHSAFVLCAAESRADSSLDCTLTFQLFQCQHGNPTRGPCSFIIIFSPHTSAFFHRDQETNRRLKNVSGKSCSKFLYDLMIWLICLSCLRNVTKNSLNICQLSSILLHKNNLLHLHQITWFNERWYLRCKAQGENMVTVLLYLKK